MVSRWGQAAAAPAGRLLVVLDRACQARGRVRGRNAIVRHRAPVVMAIEPHSLAWLAGQRGPDRSGERGREVLTTGPCLEHVSADGGQGLERGVKLAHAARGMQSEASEAVSSQAMTMGLDVFHTRRKLAHSTEFSGRAPTPFVIPLKLCSLTPILGHHLQRPSHQRMTHAQHRSPDP